MNEQLMKKAKEAKSVEELLTLAKENNYPMDEEGAEEIFRQLHAEGELCDDELDSVSGGGCACYTKVGGKKYVIVTPDLKCFNNCFELNVREHVFFRGSSVISDYQLIVQDNASLRQTWLRTLHKPLPQVCGNCRHLKFKSATGYCGVS